MLACATLSLASCATGAPTVIGSAATEPLAAYNQQIFSNQVAEEYKLNATDVVRITVFREPDLSLERAVVSADGIVSIPLVGSVRVAGKTVEQVEQELESAFGTRFLRDPDVSVNIVEYASHRVTVEGSVEEPGLYTFQPGTRLSGAIALANGLARVAQREEVAVFRQSADGIEVAKFDYAAVQAGTMMDPVLIPGDRVVVGTDGLSEFWQDLLKALPAFALFTQI